MASLAIYMISFIIFMIYLSVQIPFSFHQWQFWIVEMEIIIIAILLII